MLKTKTIVSFPRVIHIIEDEISGRKFRGIAKCNPEDVWDENKGIEIAILRANIKRDAFIANRLDKEESIWARECDKILDSIGKRALKVKLRLNKNIYKLERII